MKCPYCQKEISMSELAREIGSHTSEKKKISSRLNGLKPCKPGLRRGRPVKIINNEMKGL